ncbi:uncharacterized protein LOC128304145 [Anopheles moucheti]|uniref:uncharacterized protein LOC128304145 n=1 Tax=Anopheles moucheti TaxID=186751 RepID=UPI0022F01C88|nr:uncharacterized protein LOC128304145 [Anopheles moucheti]
MNLEPTQTIAVLSQLAENSPVGLLQSVPDDDPPLIKFRALQYALFSTSFVEILVLPDNSDVHRSAWGTARGCCTRSTVTNRRLIEGGRGCREAQFKHFARQLSTSSFNFQHSDRYYSAD